VDITRVQRWVMSSLLIVVLFAHSFGMVLGAVYGVDDSHPDAKIGLLTLAVLMNVGAVVGVRLINERSWLTPWLVTALIPSAIGVYAITNG
jgi:hypothetical protein